MERDNITLRQAEPKDVPALLAIYRPYVEQTAITFEYEVPSQEEFAKRMEKVLQKYPYLAAESQGEILGYAYAGAFKDRAAYDWAVETSIYVKMGAKRQGIGRKLYQALEQVLKAQNILNLNACIGCPQGQEGPYLTYDSIRFHERMGYQMAGHFHQCGYKFNTWFDMVWMEKHLGAHLEQQPAVIPFPRLRDLKPGSLNFQA